jgi:hypothetical protein
MKQRQKATPSPSTTTHAMWRKVLKSETLGYEAFRKNDWRSQLSCYQRCMWSTVATVRKDPSEGNVIPVLLTSIQCCNDIGSVFYQGLSSQFASMFTARDKYIDGGPRWVRCRFLATFNIPSYLEHRTFDTHTMEQAQDGFHTVSSRFAGNGHMW